MVKRRRVSDTIVELHINTVGVFEVKIGFIFIYLYGFMVGILYLPTEKS